MENDYDIDETAATVQTDEADMTETEADMTETVA